MSLTTTTQAELAARSRDAFHRSSALLRQVDPTLPLRSSEWRVRDVAAHLLTVMYRYTRRDITDPAGLSDRPAGLAVLNRQALQAVPDVSYPDLLDQLSAEFNDYISRPPLELTQRFPFHAGMTIDGAGAAANVIGEFAIHGFDVARAAGRAWSLDNRDMTLMLDGNLQVAPAWLKPEAEKVAMSVVLRVRGATPQLLQFAEGNLTIGDYHGGVRADAVVRAPASTLALLLYNRIGLPAAALKGVVITGGRRPWLGLKMTSLFLPI